MRRLTAAAVLLAGLAGPARAASDGEIRRAVVKIFTTYQKPDWYQPWQTASQDSLSGSGVIIEGNRILTNAHVTSDSIFVQVRRAGEAKKYNAKVEYVGHDCELATLKVDDPEFFKDSKPLPLGVLPNQRDKVAAYGFPAGGDDLSITEGIVSRIEVIEYTHSGRKLLALQTDAAINPGNSGGPVVKGGRLVGISFQSYSGQGVENIGYVVPVTIVRRFLKDIVDGSYDEIPDLGVAWEQMENDSLRAFYRMNMTSDQTGVLVNKIMYGSSAWGVLREGDVLLGVDGVDVANDGTYLFEKDKRLSFTHLISMRQRGETAKLDVLRDGKALKLTVKLRPTRDIVDGPLYDVKPTYYVYAGLVFEPVTRNFINLWSQPNIPTNFKALQEYVLPSEERRQVAVLAFVLPDEASTGYHDFRSILVDSVNGRHIAEFKDLIEAFKHPEGGFQVIRTDPLTDFGGKIVLDAKKADAAHEAILKRHGIPSDRSADLK